MGCVAPGKKKKNNTLGLPPEISVTKQRYFGVYVCMHLQIIILKFYLFYKKNSLFIVFRLYIPGITWMGWGSPGDWQEHLALGSPVHGSMKRLHPAGWNRRGFACSLPLDVALTPLHSDRCTVGGGRGSWRTLTHLFGLIWWENNSGLEVMREVKHVMPHARNEGVLDQ